ncbi:DEAD/DEAH box helicase family protein [Salicibibacter cibi]|uniref:DEAD/DEAH box helicase family protein n=1 Tax=Salicibibacter cibi TaxID=2743001 RepID=A0A7T6Z9X8_9BACI|nr:DEAD/DEAH box helicase family protein [Salicibibacter cibi]QQK79621.1 DEAD/DEAH box helicase family protein [Salicibibacter cibi]
MDLHKQLQQVQEENDRLKQEHDELKASLEVYKNKYEKHKAALLTYRINVFNQLFRGRTDVFPVRWETKDGHVGYSPSKNSELQYRSLTDQVIHEHLSGEQTIGIYPVLKDNSCFFLAVDFDKRQWQEDVNAFIEICEEYHAPVSIERSRSGNGCHVWFFFSEAVPAALARQFGNYLLERTREKGGSLDSYDRMFPAQDAISKDGLGNLIALPLQREPRNQGNSVFLDKVFSPFSDQWAYLSTVQRLSLNDIQATIGKHEALNEYTKSTKIAKKPILEVKNGMHIEKGSLPPSVLQECQQVATFSNPKYHKNKRLHLSTKEILKTIRCYDVESNHVVFPRGCYEKIMNILHENNLNPDIQDDRSVGRPIEVEFSGELLAEQLKAFNEIMSHNDGILVAPTGFGKTVIAAAMIAKRKVNTLVIVDRKQLIHQWKERLQTFLEIKAIGEIGGGKYNPSDLIDIATYQSLNQDRVKGYGQIIVDECHHAASYSVENILKLTDAKFVHGLTATPTRSDGLQPIMKMQCGPIRHKVKSKNHHIEHILMPKYTSFKSTKQNKKRPQDMYDEISNDDHRNNIILNDVIKALDRGRSPLILTERREHMANLEDKFNKVTKNTIVLMGGLKTTEEQERLKQLQELPTNEERLIIATGKYIGEGFDDERLDTLFLTMPISWKGTLQQYIGRLQRKSIIKDSIEVYDYVDHHESLLQNMFEKRSKEYKALGFKIEDERNKDGKQTNLFNFQKARPTSYD